MRSVRVFALCHCSCAASRCCGRNNMQPLCRDPAVEEMRIKTTSSMQRQCSDTADTAKWEQARATTCSDTAVSQQKRAKNSNNVQRHCSDSKRRTNNSNNVQRHCSDTAKRVQATTTECRDTAVVQQSGGQYMGRAD